MTRIAVVVPHYRQAEFLAECLDSLLAQTRVPDEILVVDSSPLETGQIMARYGAPVRHIVRPPAGVAAARNAGLAATECDLVAFLDSDNGATPDRLQRQEQAFEEHPDAVLCHGAMILVDRNGMRYTDAHRFGSEQVPFERQLGWLLERNRIAADTVCVKRDVVVALGGFCETHGVREDYDLWLRMASFGRFLYIDAQLARYRRHENNLSNDERYMFEWEAGALRRVAWPVTRDALRAAFPDQDWRRIVEGEVRLRRGERDFAARRFTSAAEGSTAGAALFHLAHLSADRGDLQGAERFLRDALALDRDNAASWNNLGVVLALGGNGSGAAEAFARAVALRANYDDACRNLARAKRGASGAWKLTRRRLRPELMPLAATASQRATP